MSEHKHVTFNTSENRYEMSVDGQMVYADVRRDNNVLYIEYVYAPPELRGKGAAGQLMTRVMAIVRAEHLKVVPICGYAAGWLQRHQEYADLIHTR